MSHTPAPWKFERQDIYLTAAEMRGKALEDHEGYFRHNDGSWVIGGPGDEGPVCAAIFKGKAKRGQAWNAADPEGQANARLIAAAPELLEALKAWEKWERDSEGNYSDIVNASKAAIAKATGGSK